MNLQNRYRCLGPALVATALLAIAGCSEDPQSGSEAARADDSLEPVQILDHGFGQPVSAVTLEVPAGWRPSGGIQWNRQVECIANSMRIEWSALAPDGARAVEIIPGFTWQVDGWQVQLNPCPVASMSTVREYLYALTRELYPGQRCSSIAIVRTWWRNETRVRRPRARPECSRSSKQAKS